ncbi:ribonuclease domain-containing protein [Stenotrophomonas acidaminiphila]|uniref:ribonuclease domain-containing protein n=1 Tax=Stenotrophomonas acidaminiphila TaxID=128780 RepID=UPI0028A65277|nr:ribonuclease domain-containing protein [Stenotrophomonas acidaminiphila]
MRKPLLLLTAVVVLVAGLWAMRTLQQPPPPQFAPALGQAVAPERAGEPRRPGAGDALPAFLPPEAHDTIALILRGGPFPHRQDGSVFGNRERRLPQRPRGYYREYTVRTPDLGHRGARRIVTGGDPPDVWYYTDDHYETFRDFQVPANGGAQ